MTKEIGICPGLTESQRATPSYCIYLAKSDRAGINSTAQKISINIWHITYDKQVHFWACDSKKMSKGQTKAGNQECFDKLDTHSQHAEQLLFSCLCSKVTV